MKNENIIALQSSALFYDYQEAVQNAFTLPPALIHAHFHHLKLMKRFMSRLVGFHPIA